MTILQRDGSSCRLWLDGPRWDTRQTAAVGEVDLRDVDAGAALLAEAAAQARAAGRGAVLAPMDGDTWHAYRAVTESDGSPAFALEPRSGPHDLAALQRAGFSGIAHYQSSRMPLGSRADAPAGLPGITIVPWDGRGAENLLDQLFALAGDAFADKLFFKPIDRDAFLRLYRPLLSLVDPRLVLFARDEAGALAGFLFGLPDPVSGAAILKTYAGVRPGVGRLLAHHFHEAARTLGFHHAIHALMHEANVSVTRSGQNGATAFRRYTLFGRRL